MLCDLYLSSVFLKLPVNYSFVIISIKMPVKIEIRQFHTLAQFRNALIRI